MISSYLGDSPVAAIVAGLSILVLINTILSIVQAHKSSTDNINFSVLPDFIKPLLMYIIFVVAMEAMMLVAKGIPILQTVFTGVEIVGIASIVIKYVKQIYDKLKWFGMPVDPNLDRIVENKLDSSVADLAGTTIDTTPTTETTTLDSGEVITPNYVDGYMDTESNK
jgi:hypothetical protein